MRTTWNTSWLTSMAQRPPLSHHGPMWPKILTGTHKLYSNLWHLHFRFYGCGCQFWSSVCSTGIIIAVQGWLPNFFEVIDWALSGISELEWTITSYLHWAEARFLVIQYETSCYNPEDPDHEEVDSVKRFKLDQTISDTYDGNVHHHTGRFQDFIHVPFPKVSHFQLKWYKVGWANIKKKVWDLLCFHFLDQCWLCF